MNRFNEEMIENLFGYNAAAEKNKATNKKSSASQDPSSNFVQIIDGKKAQNLSILLKALNVTTNEVCDALNEGNFLLTFIMFSSHFVSLCCQSKRVLFSYGSKIVRIDLQTFLATFNLYDPFPFTYFF